jgi:hypothetical protein
MLWYIKYLRKDSAPKEMTTVITAAPATTKARLLRAQNICNPIFSPKTPMCVHARQGGKGSFVLAEPFLFAG